MLKVESTVHSCHRLARQTDRPHTLWERQNVPIFDQKIIDEEVSWVTDQLIEVFPIVLRHQSERAEHGPAEIVEVSVPIVRVVSCFLTYVTRRTHLRILASVASAQTSSYQQSTSETGITGWTQNRTIATV